MIPGDKIFKYFIHLFHSLENDEGEDHCEGWRGEEYGSAVSKRHPGESLVEARRDKVTWKPPQIWKGVESRQGFPVRPLSTY